MRDNTVMSADNGAAERIARFRKLAGWSQHQLAARAFVSTSLIKKVEQGRTPASPSLVSCCARALGVDASVLYGTDPEEQITEQHVERAGVEELRAALHAYDDPELVNPLHSAPELQRQLNAAEKLRHSFRYHELCRRMPELLNQLYARTAFDPADTSAGEHARSMLHDAYRLVATLGGRFHQPGIGAMASERHVALAPRTGDPLRVALSAYHRSTHFLRHGQFARGLRVIERGHESVRESRVPQRESVAIQLHLRAAVLAARAGDTERADTHISEARAARQRYDPPVSPYYNTDSSALNIDVHWCAIPVENYDGTGALTRAEQVHIVDRNRPERVGHHHIDMARAWLLHGDREKVMVELNAARHISPHHTRRHPTVRETVRTLAETDRRATDTLAGFARWVGIRL
ncbi:Helix-turn-helix domain-containing protein [Actinopolyspora lacussalsi subsp. righensis]|uniref:Helix-turn-helix domain-containing protein n=2 Tax=Actinopolyspora righensis TaxID=995060 RepID=A0A1I7BSG2_9ACTN|nr:Helix-turn-helix domain-containing protein [Actinopolyspora righensis]